MIAVACLGFLWARKESRWVIGAWLLLNVIGSGWMFSFVRHHGDRRADVGGFMRVMLAMTVLHALSSSMALLFGGRIKKVHHKPSGWRVVFVVEVLCVSASSLAPWATVGMFLLIVSIVAMLAVAMVDPRPLIALTIAVGTPVLAAALAVLANPGATMRSRVGTSLVLVMLVAFVSVRSSTLLRRLEQGA